MLVLYTSRSVAQFDWTELSLHYELACLLLWLNTKLKQPADERNKTWNTKDPNGFSLLSPSFLDLSAFKQDLLNRRQHREEHEGTC